MRKHTYLLRMLGFILGCLSTFSLFASAIEASADQTIETLYHNLKSKKNLNFQEKIVWMSRQFIDKPYLLGALGEGLNARYDQYPLYRIDAFDCETYVDTILALALADNLTTFKEQLLKIRYKGGKPAYIHRNHFTDLDWNLNNQAQGLVQDITPSFKGADIKIAEAYINKPSWYKKRPLDTIRLVEPNPKESRKRLKTLHSKANNFSIQKASIPYLPFSSLFNAERKANAALFAQIPQASIIEIIRPNWNLEKVIGSNLNVSHLGFAIWKNNKLYFRQASSEYKRIIDVPLVEYLEKNLDSPTIKGINVQIALPKN